MVSGDCRLLTLTLSVQTAIGPGVDRMLLLLDLPIGYMMLPIFMSTAVPVDAGDDMFLTVCRSCE